MTYILKIYLKRKKILFRSICSSQWEGLLPSPAAEASYDEIRARRGLFPEVLNMCSVRN